MTTMQRFERLGAYLYRQTLKPRSQTEDTQRRELILNILLAGLTTVAVIAGATSIIYRFILDARIAGANSFPMTFGFIGFLVVLWYLSRRGYYQIGVYTLLALIWVGATNLAVGFSVELPGAELTFALGVVIAGVLVSGRSGLVVAGLTTFVVVGLGALQASHILNPNTTWLRQPVETGDAIGYGVIFIVIGLVAWLANREIDKSLRRAHTSEAALKNERDNLEDRVIQRTEQLEKTQLERLLELQRFAEFGRFSAGLLHDLANPLTAASLNLEQLKEGPRSQLIREATQSLRYLEGYIEAARKQLQQESMVKDFAVGPELKQVLQILEHKARGAQVDLIVRQSKGRLRLYGDQAKFSQVAANLIANAIEAYPKASRHSDRRVVEIELSLDNTAVSLSVHDWGVGVATADIPHLFNPFYTTKRGKAPNMGIGLAIVKEIVTTDFRGTIQVTSAPADGTRFVARLRDGRQRRSRR